MALTVEIRGDASQVIGEFQKVGQGISRLEASTLQSLNRLEQQTGRTGAQMAATFTRLERAAQSLAQVLGVTLGVELIRRLGRSFLESALAMDDARQSLQAVTGSSQAAGREMQFLQAVAQKTGTAVATLAQQWAALFAAANTVPGRLEAARAAFVAITEVAPRLGKSSEQVGLALYGLQQLTGGVTVQLDELQRQIGDQLPGLMPALARELNLGQQELRNLASAGKLLVDDVLPAMERAIRSLAASDGPVATARAEFGRLSSAWTNLMDSLAQAGALGVVTKSVQLLTGYVQLLTDGFKGLQFRMGLGLSEEEKTARRLNELSAQMTNLANSMKALEKIEGFDFSQMEEQMRTLNQEAVQLQQQLTQLQTPPPSDTAKRPPAGPTDEQLKATAERLKAQESLVSASLKRQEADIQRHFAEQRRLAEQYYQEQRVTEPEQLVALGRERELALQQMAQRETVALIKARQAASNELLRRQLSTLDAEIAAAKGAVDKIAALEGEKTRAKAEHTAKAAEFSAQLAEVETKASAQATDAYLKDLDTQLKATEKQQDLLEKVREQGLTDFQRQTEDIRRDIERKDEQTLRRQEDAYRSFADRVTTRFAGIFEDLLEGNLNVLETFRKLFLSTIAHIAAEALARPIIVPIVATVLGGIAGALSPGIGQAILQSVGLGGGGGGILGTAGTIGQAAGAANQLGLLGGLGSLFGQTSPIGIALSGFVNMLDKAAVAIGGTIANIFGLTTFPASGLGALAGLGGIGGGIFSALNARGLGGQIGGGIGAAAGGTALAASLGLVAIPGLQPLALAIAALAPLLGGLIDSLTGARKGPRLAIGELGGLGIGTTAGGTLEVTGELTSRILQAERIGGEQEIQAALESSTTALIRSMIDVINSIAPDPAALLGPTQQALQQALQDALVINSSRRRNFAEDMKAQLAFVQIQIGSALLDPISQAFEQLAFTDLEQRVHTLPAAVAQMTQILTDFNTQIAALEQTANEDVKGRLPEVRARLARFQERFVETLLRSLDEAFSEPAGFRQGIVLAATLPQEVTALDPRLAAFAAAAQLVAPVLAQLVQSITELETAITPTNELISQTTEHLATLREELAEVGTNLQAAVPLFEQIRQAILSAAALQIRNIQEGGPVPTAEGPGVSREQAALGRLLTAFRAAVAQLEREIAAIEEAIAVRQRALRLTELAIRTDELALAVEEARFRAAEKAIEAQERALAVQQTQLEALQAEIQVRTDAREALQQEVDQARSLSDRIGGLIRAGEPPIRAAESIRGEIAARQARLGTLTGAARLETFDELVALNEELVRLGQSTHQLDLQQEGIDNLRALQGQVDQQRSVAEQQLAAAEATLASLQAQATSLESLITSTQAGIDLQREALGVWREHLDNARESLNQRRLAVEIARHQLDLDIERSGLEAKREALEEKKAVAERLERALIKKIQEDTLQKLKDLETQLAHIFEANVAIARVLGAPEAGGAPLKTAASVSPVPLPVTVTNLPAASRSPAERENLGGLVSGFRWGGPLMPMQSADLLSMQRFQYGGRAIMAEPGEMVFPGPLQRETVNALQTVNQTFPRFQVRGTGEGDTVPLTVPEGSFVLNRRAARVVRGIGFQGGGQVQGTGKDAAPITFNISITVHAQVNNKMDIRNIANELSRHFEQQVTASLRNKRFLGA